MKSFNTLVVALIAVGAIWLGTTPVKAQLGQGCTCPAGYTLSGLQCIKPLATPLAAICTRPVLDQTIGHIAAIQQQASFSGVQMMLQQRRDQLQGTLSGHGTSSGISGYSSSDFDTDLNALGYDRQSQKANPLASPLYDAVPPAAPAIPHWGVWAQGLGNWERDAAMSPTDITHFTSTYAAQGGVDGTWQGLMSSDDALVVGIVSSWTSSHVSFDNSPATMQLVGPGVGVYSEYVRGGFSADLTTIVNLLQLNQDLAGLAPNVSVGITTAGLSGNVQYKITGAGNNFLEPTVGFSFTRTIFGSGATPDMENSSTLRLQAGARVGTTWQVNGISIDSSLKALVYGDAIAGGTSIEASAFGEAIARTDEGLIRGELDPELCFNLADGYSVTLSGSAFYGQAVVGGSAGVNLRKQW